MRKVIIILGLCGLLSLTFIVARFQLHRVAERPEKENPDIRESSRISSGPIVAKQKSDATAPSIQNPGSDLSKMEDRLRKARLLPNMMERTIECSRIIAEMCSAGHVEEAWALIDPNAGQVRNSEILQFFKTAGLNLDQFSDRLDMLSYKGEASSALSGYLHSMSLGEISTLISGPDFESILNKFKEIDPGCVGNVLAGNILGILQRSKSPESRLEAVNSALDFHKKGLLNDRSLIRIVSNDDSKDSFAKFSILSERMKPSSPNTEVGRMRMEVIDQMINDNAQQAMANIIKQKGYQGSVDIMHAITKYGAANSVEANQWYQNNQQFLDNTQKDAVAIGFWRISLVYSEKETAQQWLDQVKDAKLKDWALKYMKSR